MQRKRTACLPGSRNGRAIHSRARSSSPDIRRCSLRRRIELTDTDGSRSSWHDSCLIYVMKPGWFLERILVRNPIEYLNETAILLPSSSSRIDFEHAHVHSGYIGRTPRRRD